MRRTLFVISWTLVAGGDLSVLPTQPRVQHQDRIVPHEELALWHFIRNELMKPSAENFFNTSMRGGMLPSLRGTVIESSVSEDAVTLIVSLSGDNVPEATLKFDHKLKHNVENGQVIIFQGLARSFTQNPLMLFFDASEKRMTIVRNKAMKQKR